MNKNSLIPKAREALDRFKIEASNEVSIKKLQSNKNNNINSESGSVHEQNVKKIIDDFDQNLK